MGVVTAPGVIMSTNVISVGKTHWGTMRVYLNWAQWGRYNWFARTSKSLLAPNLRTAEDQPEVLSAKLDKEWSARRIVGPFSSHPFANFVSSPLGIIPKETPGEFRIIHHLSYPDGSFVNDFTPSENSTVHYASISDAIAIIKSISCRSYVSKTDIKSVSRIILIHPDDYHLLGMKWI